MMSGGDEMGRNRSADITGRARAEDFHGCLLFGVIACDKREAFVQGSAATKQSIAPRAERWIASAFAKASADKSLRSQ
jgi:hypothetical protein